MIGADRASTRDLDRFRRFQRLLRAYPAAWRQEHGEVLLSTLLDVAEQRSLDRPTPRQSLDIVVHGAREQLREAGLIGPRRVTASVATGSLIGVVLVLMATDMPMPRFGSLWAAVIVIAAYGTTWLLTARFLLLAQRGRAIATMLLAAAVSLWAPSVLSGQPLIGMAPAHLSAYYLEAVLQTAPAQLGVPAAFALIALIARPEPRLVIVSTAGTTLFALVMVATCGELLGLGQLSYAGHPAALPVSAVVVPIGFIAALAVAAGHARHRRGPAAASLVLCAAPWAACWTLALLIALVVPVPILIYQA